MAQCTWVPGISAVSGWRPRADEMFGVEGMHLRDVSTRGDGTLVLEVESDQTVSARTAVWSRSDVDAGSSWCTTLRASAVQCGCAGPKRIWRCPEPACPRRTWTEDHGFASPRTRLTRRAIGWAVDGLRHDDTTIS